MTLKFHDPVIFNRNAFTFQQFLHQIGMPEMMLCRLTCHCG